MIRDFVSDRLSLVLIAAIIIAGTSVVVISVMTDNIVKRNHILKRQLEEINALSFDFHQLRSIVDQQEKKVGLTNESGVVAVIERILANLGIEASVIQPLAKRTTGEFLEQDVEVELQGVNLNSIVNILYRLENGPQALKMKNALMKASFENPDIFTLRITVSLVGKHS